MLSAACYLSSRYSYLLVKALRRNRSVSRLSYFYIEFLILPKNELNLLFIFLNFLILMSKNNNIYLDDVKTTTHFYWLQTLQSVCRSKSYCHKTFNFNFKVFLLFGYF